MQWWTYGDNVRPKGVKIMPNSKARPQNDVQRSCLREGIKKSGRVLLVNKCQRREKNKNAIMDLRQSRAAEGNKNNAYVDRVRPKGIKITPKFESWAAEWRAEKSYAWRDKEVGESVVGW